MRARLQAEASARERDAATAARDKAQAARAEEEQAGKHRVAAVKAEHEAQLAAVETKVRCNPLSLQYYYRPSTCVRTYFKTCTL